MITLRRLTKSDLPRLREVWKENWGDEFMVEHGVIYRPDTLEGFIAFDGHEWVGEITYNFTNDGCEIVTLDSEREGLSAEQAAACEQLLRMPMRGKVTSLNLAVATGVMLYHMLEGFD